MTSAPTLLRSDAGRAAVAAEKVLRTPLLDYQLAELERITAMLDDTRYAYPTVVAIWPRRTGKTTSILSLALGRCLFLPGYRAAYTEKTGHDVSLRFTDWIEAVHASPLAGRFRTRKSAGTERITVKARHSFVRAFPPKPAKLRGDAMDLVILDEAQEHDDELGMALDASIGPTMDTRPRRQLIITGTAGDPTSTYFRRHYDAARAGAPGYVLSEIGTWPADADPTDEDVWHTYHPGLRAGLTDVSALRENLGRLGPDSFAREYGNRWATAADDTLIDTHAWQATAWADPVDQPRRFVVGYDVAWDRSAASVVAAWADDTGTAHLEVVAQRPGTAWLADYLADLWRRRRPHLVVDSGSPARDVTRALQARRVKVEELPTGDYTAACAELVTETHAATVGHRPDVALDAAVAAARKRPIGDRYVIDRRVAVDVSPLTAAAAALYRTRRPPAPPVMI